MDNYDQRKKYAYLDQLSTADLENILRADMDSSEEGDLDMVLYIMEVIEHRENEKSLKNITAVENAKEEFYRVYYKTGSTGQVLYTSEKKNKIELEHPSSISRKPVHESTMFSRRFRRISRVGLVAILSVICLIGVMVTAQAVGLNVFDIMARWTSEVFSFGPGEHETSIDVVFDSNSIRSSEDNRNKNDCITLQEALDLHEITEFSEPKWIPDGYLFDCVTVSCWPDGSLIRMVAEYTEETNHAAPLHIEIIQYEGAPCSRVEKTDTPVDIVSINDITVYLFGNTNNNTAAWATEHYEFYISGAIEKDLLERMVRSAYTDVQ